MKVHACHPDTTTELGFVWVYQYLYWDEVSRTHQTSKRFATIEVIRCGLGEPVHASAKKIALAKLIDGAFAE